MTQYGPWEIFNGGECPLKDGERAQVQVDCETREDALEDTPLYAGEIGWCYVIAYRRVIEPKPVSVTGYVQVSCGNAHIYSSNVGPDVRGFKLTITGEDIKAEWVDD